MEMNEPENKREKAIKDRFVVFLKEQEGTDYKTIGWDVRNNNPKGDFDYLLKSASGSELALEITTLTDKDEYFTYANQQAEVVGKLDELIHLDKMPGNVIIRLPYKHLKRNGTPMTLVKLRNKLDGYCREAADVIHEQVKQLTNIGDKISSSIQLGYVSVELISKDQQLFTFGCENDRYGSVEDDYQYVLSELARLVPGKDEQLNADFDKRILLISRQHVLLNKGMILEAASEFVKSSSEYLRNTDEMYVEVSWGKFHRVYPSSNGIVEIRAE